VGLSRRTALRGWRNSESGLARRKSEYRRGWKKKTNTWVRAPTAGGEITVEPKAKRKTTKCNAKDPTDKEFVPLVERKCWTRDTKGTNQFRSFPLYAIRQGEKEKTDLKGRGEELKSDNVGSKGGKVAVQGKTRSSV